MAELPDWVHAVYPSSSRSVSIPDLPFLHPSFSIDYFVRSLHSPPRSIAISDYLALIFGVDPAFRSPFSSSQNPCASTCTPLSRSRPFLPVTAISVMAEFPNCLHSVHSYPRLPCQHSLAFVLSSGDCCSVQQSPPNDSAWFILISLFQWFPYHLLILSWLPRHLSSASVPTIPASVLSSLSPRLSLRKTEFPNCFRSVHSYPSPVISVSPHSFDILASVPLTSGFYANIPKPSCYPSFPQVTVRSVRQSSQTASTRSIYLASPFDHPTSALGRLHSIYYQVTVHLRGRALGLLPLGSSFSSRHHLRSLRPYSQGCNDCLSRQSPFPNIPFRSAIVSGHISRSIHSSFSVSHCVRPSSSSFYGSLSPLESLNSSIKSIYSLSSVNHCVKPLIPILRSINDHPFLKPR
jgi:hypothetical protein